MTVLDTEQLPEFARQELIDFYQFLLKKYADRPRNPLLQRTTPLAPRLVPPFVPMSREQLYER